jgi:hypothetical protein
MRHEQVESWVVFEKHVHGKAKMTLLCEQGEWDALATAEPNPYTLVRGGITNEGEAERLARTGAVVVKGKAAAAKPLPRSLATPPGRARTALRRFWTQSERLAAGG